ncbi:MAG: hypothetical protein U1D97_00935, partial [Desulfuromonadales bacterium]|nr:hypothetical protein [Desulfuromonadales bacterium]
MKTFLIAALHTSLALLQGCGSSSDDNSVATTTISGSVVAAPVAGATVLVKDSSGVTVAGPVMTSSTGEYSIVLPTSALNSDLRFEATGGTFTDEATGTSGVTAGKLGAYIAGGTLATSSAVHLDPASSIVHEMVVNGKALSVAKTDFTTAFGFTPDPAIAPKNEAPAAIPAENMAQRLAALRAAAFSQLTKDLSLPPEKQFLLLAALSKDLEDGMLDGKNTDGAVNIDETTFLPEDAQCRFSQALLLMQQDTTQNRTGLTVDQIGSITDNRTALTDNYKVELLYPSGVTNAKQGKTSFTIKLANRSDNSPATGQALKLIPYMHMATKDHSSPVDAVVDNGDGTYICTVYYLMTTMMSGVSQGVWELQIKINDTETATFFPNVGMAMGAGPVRLYGSESDMVASMGTMPPAKRTYLLFKDSVNAATNTFNLFLATRDDAMMMKFPAVSGGSTLTDSVGTPWNVVPATSSVQISTDNVSYFDATDNGGGHWSASNAGLTLTPGATVYVKVTINSEVKTDLAGTTEYATFTLPSM